MKYGEIVKHFILNLFRLKHFHWLNAPWFLRNISVGRSHRFEGNGKWDPVHMKGFCGPSLVAASGFVSSAAMSF